MATCRQSVHRLSDKLYTKKQHKIAQTFIQSLSHTPNLAAPSSTNELSHHTARHQYPTAQRAYAQADTGSLDGSIHSTLAFLGVLRGSRFVNDCHSTGCFLRSLLLVLCRCSMRCLLSTGTLLCETAYQDPNGKQGSFPRRLGYARVLMSSSSICAHIFV